jgi:hypothetical protein
MRFFIHSVALFLLPVLLPDVSWAQRPASNPVEPRERTIPGRTRVKPPLPPEQESQEALDVGLPKEGEAAPPLDRSIGADRLPEQRPPLSSGALFRRTYTQVQVLGSGVREFYYVRQDILLQFSDGRSTGLQQVLNSGNYGPHPIGGSVPMVAGANYALFPACRGGISWATHRLARLPADSKKGQVTLSCRP